MALFEADIMLSKMIERHEAVGRFFPIIENEKENVQLFYSQIMLCKVRLVGNIKTLQGTSKKVEMTNLIERKHIFVICLLNQNELNCVFFF